MKAILISDHAKWCALMMNGIKKTEVRKGTALYKATQKLIDEYGFAEFYVYCTKGKERLVDLRDDSFYCGMSKRLNGKVVFKFRCYKVEEIRPFEEYESPFGRAYKLTEDKILCCIKAQLTYDEYNHYLKGKTSTAIHISDLEIFDKPKEISEFKHLLKGNKHDHSIDAINIVGGIPLTKAPQSWCYIHVQIKGENPL